MAYTQLQPKNDRKAGIIRLIVLAFMLVNQALATFGNSPLPFTSDQVYEFVSTVATWLMAGYTAYKNTNLSAEAQDAQAVLEQKKSAKK